MSVTYTTAHSNARSLTHWLRPGIKPASSWVFDSFPLSHNGNNCWMFLNQFQFQYLWLVWSSFLFQLGLVLEDCAFVRICPFLLDCLFYWHIIVVIFCISVMFIVTSPFSLLIWLIRVISLFFLMRLDKGLSIMLIFSKNLLLVSLTFSMVFFISISFISDQIFMISSADFMYCLFFSL